MQTFLPLDTFALSAVSLDRQRLGKQRVEVLQILKALNGETTGWVNHPVTRAWRGHESQLVDYGIAVCEAWIGRGYRDSCLEKIDAYRPGSPTPAPRWLGNPEVYAAYRQLLVFKMPEYYRDELGWVDEPSESFDYESLFQLGDD